MLPIPNKEINLILHLHLLLNASERHQIVILHSVGTELRHITTLVAYHYVHNVHLLKCTITPFFLTQLSKKTLEYLCSGFFPQTNFGSIKISLYYKMGISLV